MVYAFSLPLSRLSAEGVTFFIYRMAIKPVSLGPASRSSRAGSGGADGVFSGTADGDLCFGAPHRDLPGTEIY